MFWLSSSLPFLPHPWNSPLLTLLMVLHVNYGKVSHGLLSLGKLALQDCKEACVSMTGGESSTGLPSQLKSLRLSSLCVSLHPLGLHSFGPSSILPFRNLKKLHANSGKDGLENVRRRLRWQWDICDVCRDIIPLSPACCCVKKEFAGLMQFALSFFAVSKKDLIQPPSNYKECEPATQ